MGLSLPALVVLPVFLALITPASRRGRLRSLRWIVGPVVLLGLALNWFATWFGEAAQENCTPDCLTPGDVTVAGVLFAGGTAAWLVALVATTRRHG